MEGLVWIVPCVRTDTGALAPRGAGRRWACPSFTRIAKTPTAALREGLSQAVRRWLVAPAWSPNGPPSLSAPRLGLQHLASESTGGGGVGSLCVQRPGEHWERRTQKSLFDGAVGTGLFWAML